MVLVAVDFGNANVWFADERGGGDAGLWEEALAVAAPWGVECEEGALFFCDALFKVEWVEFVHDLRWALGFVLGVVFDEVTEAVNAACTGEFDAIGLAWEEELEGWVAVNFVAVTNGVVGGAVNTCKDDIGECGSGFGEVLSHGAAMAAVRAVELHENGLWATNQLFGVVFCDLDILSAAEQREGYEKHFQK